MVHICNPTTIPYMFACIPSTTMHGLYPGVIGNEDCEWIDAWTAYKCTNSLNYEMVIIESMDSDTETRRLSPVAVLGTCNRMICSVARSIAVLLNYLLCRLFN